jgi:hypothetical protein
MEVVVKVMKKGQWVGSGPDEGAGPPAGDPAVSGRRGAAAHLPGDGHAAARGPLWCCILHSGRLWEAEAWRLFWQMACTVVLKPNNVLLDEADNVKLTDFGLATGITPSQKLELLCRAFIISGPRGLPGPNL